MLNVTILFNLCDEKREACLTAKGRQHLIWEIHQAGILINDAIFMIAGILINDDK